MEDTTSGSDGAREPRPAWVDDVDWVKVRYDLDAAAFTEGREHRTAEYRWSCGRCGSIDLRSLPRGDE